MKKSKNLLIALLIITFAAIIATTYNGHLTLRNLTADSGFDSSYDSGSSSSSSSYSSSSSHSSHSSRPMTPQEKRISAIVSVGTVVFMVVIVILSMKLMHKREQKKLIEEQTENEEAINQIKAVMPDFNKEVFYEYVYKNFLDIQHAWMDFDYDKLRTLATDELFNTYSSQLKTLSIKHQKNVMRDFEHVITAIKEFKQSENNYTIIVNLQVLFYDYIIDKNYQTVRGNDQRRLNILYKLTYVKTNKANETHHCPNCNAALGDAASSICPFCNSVIVNNSNDYVLAKKEVKMQKLD